MANDHIAELTRNFEADPSDRNALELIKARSRVEGERVYLEALNDRLQWSNSSEAIQDLAINEAGERLGEAYQHFETKEYQCAGLKHRIATYQHSATGILLNLLPGGEYIMGSSSSDLRNTTTEPHRVTIEPFLIGRFPVRQEEWDRIGTTDKRSFKGANLPMDGISWKDCQEFLKEAGGDLRLPSESEWEYACRAGSITEYFWTAAGEAEELDSSYAWYDMIFRRIEPANTRDPSLHYETGKWNAFGLVDMIGNVLEWCEDKWFRHYDNGPNDHRPRRGNNLERTSRGGSWLSDASSCTSSARGGYHPGSRFNYGGARFAVSLDRGEDFIIEKHTVELNKRANNDPSGMNAVDLINERAKTEGSGVYLEALQDRLQWNKTPVSVQDLAINETMQRLGEAYQFLETKIYSCNDICHRIATFQHVKSGMLLNLIPGGTYTMGCFSRMAYESEKPPHEVIIQPILIGRFPIRQEEWDRIGGSDERKFQGPDLPMEGISWNDCRAWLKKARDAAPGHRLRLASESEWEYACRAGSQTDFFWAALGCDEEITESYCWHRNERSNPKSTCNVSLHYEAGKWNAFGLVDMSGNVQELCQDQWLGNYRGGPNNHKARYKADYNSRSYHVRRGGSWRSEARDCRPTHRSRCSPDRRHDSIGARFARSLDCT